MPKIKSGLDYFDIQTDICDDKRIKLLRAEFGIKGFGVWVELIRQIYADEGYYMEWDEDTKLLFASDVGESGGLVDEVVKGSVKRGLFCKSVFNQFGVLTSKHIQEKYFDAIKRRTSEREIDARYIVIPLDDNIISGNDNIKLLNVNTTEQRREEKSKEKKSIYPFDDFWDDYDKKKERKKCERKWENVSEKDREKIKKFIPIYKRHQPNSQYRKNPSTFLNNEIWNDDWSEYKPQTQQEQKPQYLTNRLG